MSVEAATTPPSSWFTDPDIYSFERRAVFGRSWVAVGRADQVAVMKYLLELFNHMDFNH